MFFHVDIPHGLPAHISPCLAEKGKRGIVKCARCIGITQISKKKQDVIMLLTP